MTLVAEESKERYNLLWVDENTELGVPALFEGATSPATELEFKAFTKYKLIVEDEAVHWNDHELNVSGKVLQVPGIKNGARIR